MADGGASLVALSSAAAAARTGAGLPCGVPGLLPGAAGAAAFFTVGEGGATAFLTVGEGGAAAFFVLGDGGAAFFVPGGSWGRHTAHAAGLCASSTEAVVASVSSRTCRAGCQCNTRHRCPTRHYQTPRCTQGTASTAQDARHTMHTFIAAVRKAHKLLLALQKVRHDHADVLVRLALARAEKARMLHVTASACHKQHANTCQNKIKRLMKICSTRL